MSTEYYTGVGFEKAVDLLKAANAGEFAFEVPVDSRYLSDCRAFLLRHVESGKAIWGLREIRDQPQATVLPPLGTLTFEAFLGNQPQLFLPWVEKTLRVRVMSEVGLPWERDV